MSEPLNEIGNVPKLPSGRKKGKAPASDAKAIKKYLRDGKRKPPTAKFHPQDTEAIPVVDGFDHLLAGGNIIGQKPDEPKFSDLVPDPEPGSEEQLVVEEAPAVSTPTFYQAFDMYEHNVQPFDGRNVDEWNHGFNKWLEENYPDLAPKTISIDDNKELPEDVPIDPVLNDTNKNDENTQTEEEVKAAAEARQEDKQEEQAPPPVTPPVEEPPVTPPPVTPPPVETPVEEPPPVKEPIMQMGNVKVGGAGVTPKTRLNLMGQFHDQHRPPAEADLVETPPVEPPVQTSESVGSLDDETADTIRGLAGQEARAEEPKKPEEKPMPEIKHESTRWLLNNLMGRMAESGGRDLGRLGRGLGATIGAGAKALGNMGAAMNMSGAGQVAKRGMAPGAGTAAAAQGLGDALGIGAEQLGEMLGGGAEDFGSILGGTVRDYAAHQELQALQNEMFEALQKQIAWAKEAGVPLDRAGIYEAWKNIENSAGNIMSSMNRDRHASDRRMGGTR